jgi:hypothetical protein
MMWRGNLSGEEFIEGFWRGRHMLHSTIVNNYKPHVDLTKRNNSWKESSVKNLDIDNFVSFYHLCLSVKDLRKKLQC